MADPRFYTSHGPARLGDLISGLDIEGLSPGFSDEIIEAAAGLAGSLPGQISFFGHKKHAAQIETARATACLVPDDLADKIGAENIIPLISKSPRAHFGRIISKLVQDITLSETGELDPGTYGPGLHKTAIISKTATLEAGVEIGPYTVIGPGVHIGAGSKIGAHVVISCAVLGKGCTVKPHATLGGQGFGVDKDELGVVDLPHIGRLIMGDHVSIGSQTTIDRGYLGDTIIANDVKIDNQVQVAHNVVIGKGSRLAAHVGVSGSCSIGENVMMGGNVGLADHLTIGDDAVLAARAGVMHNVPAGEMWSGIPAMPIRDHMRIVAATRKLIKKKT